MGAVAEEGAFFAPRTSRRYVLQVDLPGGADTDAHRRVDAALSQVASDLTRSLPGVDSRIERLASLSAGSFVSVDSLGSDAYPGDAYGGAPAAPRQLRRAVVPTLEVDLAARRVFVGEQPVQLAHKEFEILRVLLARPAEVVTRDEIVAELAGVGGEQPAPRTIDVHVHRIRTKLEGCGDCISTVRGIGYRFNASASVFVV